MQRTRTGYGARFLEGVWNKTIQVPDYDVPTTGGRRCYQWSSSPHVWMHSPPPEGHEVAPPPRTFKRSSKKIAVVGAD